MKPASSRSILSAVWILVTLAGASGPGTVRAATAEPQIEASLKKDEKTGHIDGRAETRIDLPASEVWPILTQAIHGKLSDRTKVCLSIPEKKADSLLKDAQSPLLPLSDAREASIRESLLSEGTHEFAQASPNATTTGYALRVISIPLPFTADRWFLARETYDATQAKNGRYTIRLNGSAGNIAHYDGLWTLEALPEGKTRVTLTINSDMGIPTPGFLTGLGAGELKETMRRLKQFTDQARARAASGS